MAAKSCRISENNLGFIIAPEVGRGFSRDLKRAAKGIFPQAGEALPCCALYM